jgi:hypothetical protein
MPPIHRSVKHVLLMGGVGNQLFQLAKAIDIARDGYRVKLVRVESFFLANILAYKVRRWSKQDQWLNVPELACSLGIPTVKPTIISTAAFLIQLLRIVVLGKKELLNPPRNHKYPFVSIGYYQSAGSYDEDSLIHVARSLRQFISMPKDTNIVPVIHFRTGDILLDDQLTTNEIESFLRTYNYQCICLTNNIEKASQTLKGLATFRSGSPLEDFILIASSTTILPSSSTFCFWAVLLASISFDVTIHTIPPTSYWKTISSKRLVQCK